MYFENYLGRINDLKFVTDSIELALDFEDLGFENPFSEAMMDMATFHFDMMMMAMSI